MFKGKVVFLNAPPGAGKDTIATTISNKYNTVKIEFKDPLFKIAAGVMGMNFCDFNDKYKDRAWKESVYEPLGITVRQLMIKISEEWCKPSFGKDFFGNNAANRIDMKLFNECGYIFSDCGFIEEITPIANKVGKENCVILQFTGQGSVDFTGDSRNWIDGTHIGVKTVRVGISNDIPINDFVKEICKTLEEV